MRQADCEDVGGDRLVARFARRKLLPHLSVSIVSVALAGAWLAYENRNCPAGRALIPLFVLSLLFVGPALALFAKIARRFVVVVDRDHMEIPLDGLVVPWHEVTSMTLLGGARPMVRLGVRDPQRLLATQPPDVEVARRRPRQLTLLGGVLCPLGGLDRPAREIFDTAAARLRAANPDAAVEDAGTDRRAERTRRIVVAVAVATCLVQALTFAVIVAR